jgi:HK97 family phage major capsid protein
MQKFEILSEMEALVKHEPFTKEHRSKFESLQGLLTAIAPEVIPQTPETLRFRAENNMSTPTYSTYPRPPIVNSELRQFMLGLAQGQTPNEYRDLASDAGGAGVGLVPSATLRVVEAMKAQDQLIGAATVISASGKNPIFQPGFDDAGTMAVEVSQNGSSSSGPDVLFNRATVAKKYFRSGILRASDELLQDSQAEEVLIRAIGRRLSRAAANEAANVLANDAEMVTGTPFNYDDLLGLIRQCDYSDQPGAAFVLSLVSLTYLMTMTDGVSQPLNLVRRVGPGRYTLLEFPVVLCPFVSDLGSPSGGGKVYFGDVSRLVVALNNFSVFRYVEMYAPNSEVGFQGFASMGAALAKGSNTDNPILGLSD